MTVTPPDVANTLYYGDNLDVLQEHCKDESVDVIYLDPPFNSKASYNVLFAEHDGSQSASQVLAFEDTWHWDQAAVAAYESVVERGGDVASALVALRTFLGGSDLLAYLSMMAPRLVELKRVLKPNGQIYLHCDPTAGHYLKMLLDAVFGPGRFLNEIIWHYETAGGAPKKTLIRDHDIIFRYAVGPTKNVTWHAPRDPWPESTLKKWQTDDDGRIYHIHNDTGKKYYVDPDGKLMDDVWDITLAARSSERLGYPTQKPLELLTRIIESSSNPGDVVLDPFCGCGTTIDAAHRLGRQWVGIDITHLAVNLIKHRLQDTYGEGVQFDVVGEPTDLAGAAELASSDPYQFQWWALGLVGARPTDQKKGADKGIDGRLFFHDDQGGKTKQAVLSVKAGHVTVSQIRDLRGVVEREQAALGVFITMNPSTQPMRTEAADAGSYEAPWGQKYPRLQILTIEELLGGKRIDMPPIGTMSANVSVKKAKKAPKKPRAAQHISEDHPKLL